MKHPITKFCADSLRVYLHDKCSIKLKSGHSHEIVAAFFGYKSKISLLADERFAPDNLWNATFILLDPPMKLIDHRLASLEGLPADLPPSHILAKGVYQGILDNKELSGKIVPDFHDLAVSIATDRLNQHTRHLVLNPPMKWITEMQMHMGEAETVATVTFDHFTDTGKRHNYGEVKIKFPRIAGNIGYGKPSIHPTFYSGQMSDPDFRLKVGPI